MPKPPKDELPEEDMVNTGQRRAAEAATVETQPVADEAPGATAFVRVDQIPATPPAADENPGATAFVRIEDAGSVALPPRRADKTPLAPRKGLQVQLPDEEPAPPPPPKKKVVAQAPDQKGRRGAWWDEEHPKEKEPEPPAEDDNPGATAFVRVEKPPPPPPPPEPEPEVERYRPVPVDEPPPPAEPRWKVLLRRAVVISGVFAVLGIAGIIAGYLYISREIPTFDSARDYRPIVASKVVASDGTVVGQFYRERRTVVKMDQIPRVLVQAVVSAEDKDFYKHPGFNVIALARAVVVDVLSGRKRLGASTITQQVVKNFFLTSEKKWKRKLKEVLLSLRLERNLSKDDILFLYLNQINFGKAHYGVEEASLYYFNKHVQDIDLGEAAILAGLPQNPARINPRRHPDRAKARQKYVLSRMLANHYISDDDYQREVDKPIVLPPPPPEPPGAWYLEEVRRQLLAQFGEAAVDTSGMQVEVAMDPRLQAAAEFAVQEGLRIVDKRQGWRGPEVKLDADRIEAYRAALGRRLAQVAQTTDQVWVLDLEGIHAAAVRKFTGKKPAKKSDEADDSDVAADEIPIGSVAPDVIARAAKARPLAQDEVYSGIVTQVLRNEAVVELAPGVAGSAPFSTMTWARQFKPESATPLPHVPADVVSVGDVVPVRVQRMQTVRDSSGKLRASRIEFNLEQTPKVQGAFVGMDLKSRGVLALVGGYDIAFSSFNRATARPRREGDDPATSPPKGGRQPGSSFKPFLYAAALDSGKYTPVTKMDDSPEVITDPWKGTKWTPQNFEKDEFAGPITLRKALAESKNTVAVKLLIDVGLDKVRTMARAAGIQSDIPQSYTAALGTGEVGLLEEANGYATIASEGKRADPVFIRKVLSRDGNVLMAAAGNFEQTIKPETAYLTADLMRSVIDDPAGTAHSLMGLGRPIAGKTGTASEHRDAWFIGFTPSLLAGGWVGFDTHEKLGASETGGHAAGPMWMMWMRAALANQPREEWPAPPPGVTAVKINRNTGALAAENDPYAVREVFMAGTEPTQVEEAPPNQEDWYQAPTQH